RPPHPRAPGPRLRSIVRLPGPPVLLHGEHGLLPVGGDATAAMEANTVGRYRNVDPVLASYLVRLGAERLHQDYHAFPQRALFDKLGMRDAVIYTDAYGNFLGQGSEAVAARDWARIGNLYLQDGVWNGERLLPRGY